MTSKNLTALTPQSTSLFICDIQERFKGVIWEFPSVISVANKLVKKKKQRFIQYTQIVNQLVPVFRLRLVSF